MASHLRRYQDMRVGSGGWYTFLGSDGWLTISQTSLERDGACLDANTVCRLRTGHGV